MLLIACSGSVEDLPLPQTTNTSGVTGDLITGVGMTADALKAHSETVARGLITTLGRQQTSAMLGWQVEPDYWPMQHCFDHWHGTGEMAPNEEPIISAEEIANCEQHVRDLSQLYASYVTQAWPMIFKSRY